MNDTKHTKTLISGAFGNSSDFRVGQRLIDFFCSRTEGVGRQIFFFAQRLKKLAVALNLMGQSRNRKQGYFFIYLIEV